MKIYDLARINRSVRRFLEDERVPEQQLRNFIEAARLAPCGANLQLLRFTPVTDRETCSRIFPALKWAGYLEDWIGPAPGERPAAYIIIHIPVEERRHIPVDSGIAAAYMVLSAREINIGSCMIMSFDRELIEKAVGTEDGYYPFLVIAFGFPGEETVLEETEGDIRYYRDPEGRHHIPKLSLERIILPAKD